MKRATEVAQSYHDRVTSGIANIWKVMSDCIDCGILKDGTLRGGLMLIGVLRVFKTPLSRNEARI